MKINFTKKEYAALVERVLLADWVIHAHEVELADESKPYAALRKKVLSHHREVGMEDALQYVPEDDEYYETVDYEEGSAHMAFIEADEERSFWETLAHKLAQRDLAAQETLTASVPLGPEQRAPKLFDLQGRYEDEFVAHGLDRIRLEAKTGVHWMPAVLITGTNRGLGLEWVRQCAARDWRVFATCRDARFRPGARAPRDRCPAAAPRLGSHAHGRIVGTAESRGKRPRNAVARGSLPAEHEPRVFRYDGVRLPC